MGIIFSSIYWIQLIIKYLSYPKSTEIDAFEQKICIYHNPRIIVLEIKMSHFLKENLLSIYKIDRDLVLVASNVEIHIVEELLKFD